MTEPPSSRLANRGRRRGRARRGSQRADLDWEQVWLGDGEGQASIVAGALEARGIRTRVHGYQPLPHAYPTAWANGNWAIHVPSSEALAARDHLRDSGEHAHLVEGGIGFGREQAFVLRLVLAGVLGVVIVSTIGILFYGWSL